MEATAKRTNIRTSPRKLRLVADNIRGLNADQALTSLQFTRKQAAESLSLVLKQAIANAHQLGMTNNLFIKAVQIDEGPIYRRWHAVSRGQAHGLDKKSSHIKIIIGVHQPNPTQAAIKPTESKTDTKPADRKSTTAKSTNKKTATKSETKKTTSKTTKSKPTKK